MRIYTAKPPVITAEISVMRFRHWPYKGDIEVSFRVITMLDECDVISDLKTEKRLLAYCKKHNIPITDERTGVERYLAGLAVAA